MGDEINGSRKKTCPSLSSSSGGTVTGSGSVGGGVDPYDIEWLDYTEQERIHILQVLRRDLQLKWTDYNRIRLVKTQFSIKRTKLNKLSYN
jgi:hypothetical protein